VVEFRAVHFLFVSKLIIMGAGRWGVGAAVGITDNYSVARWIINRTVLHAKED
jgi:hypothetical protein